MTRGALNTPRWRVAGADAQMGERTVPEEVAVAIVHDAATYAVLMATPADLADLAVGFSLTEGAIRAPGDVRDIEIVETEVGIEVRLWLAPGASGGLTDRRRRLAGPTGCGLCGIESLVEASRSLPRVGTTSTFTCDQVARAVAAISPAQSLGQATRAVHAAALWRPDQGLVMVREDVGRHNALDKLAGGLARQGETADGIIVLTSRVSVEMVQKAAMIGAPVIAAVSAPTSLAIRAAEDADISLAAIVREDAFEVFTGAERLGLGALEDGRPG